MVGLGRMGANMVVRLMSDGHQCIVWDRDEMCVGRMAESGATPASNLDELISLLPAPRSVWLMVPAAVTPELAEQVSSKLSAGDLLIDGGNSHYRDAVDRAEQLSERGISHVDVGTSGGVHGRERGYCLMVGASAEAFAHLEPLFLSLAPGVDAAPRLGQVSDQPPAQQEHGYLHCGPPGAGHFVKMIHNGVEYAMMAAYAEGLNILRHAGVGREDRALDAETAPLKDARYYQYEFELDRIAEVWRRGSVIPSWLLDLTAEALSRDPELSSYAGRVSDSGEGRWTQLAAIDEGVPAHVLSAALFDRFTSRGRGRFANQVLSAMRSGFGGHQEKKDK